MIMKKDWTLNIFLKFKELHESAYERDSGADIIPDLLENHLRRLLMDANHFFTSV